MVKLTYSKTAIQVVKKKVPPSLAALHKMARVERCEIQVGKMNYEIFAQFLKTHAR